MQIEGTQTEENFKNAIVGEHHALEKFLRWRSIADVVGPPEVHGLYRATSMLIAGHAAIGALYKNTLGYAINAGRRQQDPSVEFTQADVDRYLSYADVARAEGFEEMAEWFEALAEAERSQLPKTV